MTSSIVDGMQFHREAPCKRRHCRVKIPIQVNVNGKNYYTSNWSMGGLRLSKFDQDIQQGDEFSVSLTIPYQDCSFVMKQQMKVIRHDVEKMELAAEFTDMNDRNRGILSYFIQGLVTGQMTDFENIIRKVDIPVTPVSVMRKENQPKISFFQKAMRFGKASFVTGVYLIVGAVLTFYVGFTVYSNFYKLQVETAVSVSPLETLISPASGRLVRVVASQGSMVRAGEPIIHVDNSELDDAAREAKLAIDDTQLRLNEARQKLEKENQKMAVYKKIGNSRIQAAQSRVTGLNKQLVLSENELNRKRALFKSGNVPKSDLDAQEQAYAKLEEELNVSRADLQLANDSMSSVSSGLFFSGDKLQGDIPSLEAEVVALGKRLELEQQRFEIAVQKRDENSTITAPFTGVVNKIMKSEGNTVVHGEPLVILEKDESLTIVAYMTQDEIEQVKLNSKASVYIPSLDMRRQARVVSVDRTQGFIDEMKSEFRGRSSNERSGCVSLAIDDTGNIFQENIPSGLPVTVSFDRQSNSENFKTYITSLDKYLIQPLKEQSKQWLASGEKMLIAYGMLAKNSSVAEGNETYLISKNNSDQ